MPHFFVFLMKRFLPFILMSCSVLLTSCLDSYSDFIPRITISHFVRLTPSETDSVFTKDTLGVHYNSDGEYYYLDSVNVGDSILVSVMYQSFANFLVTSFVDWDSTKVSITGHLANGFDEALLPSSDIETLHFEYKTGYNGAFIPLSIIPLRSSDIQLTFSVSSDAKKVSNTTTERIYMYVR